MPPRWILWSAGGLSLAAGAWLSLDPARLADFALVMAWVRDWRDGVTPFTPEIGADYPPWALVTLVPLAWIPEAPRAPLWIAANLALVVYIARALTREVPAPDTRAWLVPALLCVASVRTLGQFSLLSFALALAGAATRSPVAGGLWLGLALMKPQVGGVIWLAHACLRDWRRVAVAAAVPIILTLGCAWGLGQSPLRVLQEYAGVLNSTHGGSSPFLGHTELEAWFWHLSGAGTSLPAAAALAAVMLAPGIVATIRQRPPAPAGVLEWYGFCGVVSLLATRHLSYDLILLLPLVVSWVAWPARRRGAAGLALLSWLILYPPAWWRRVFAPLGAPDAFAVVTELDRAICLALWVVMAVRLIRPHQGKQFVDNR